MTVISYKPCCLASIVMFASIVSLQRFQFEAAWVLWRRVGWLKQTLCLSVVNTNASHSPLNISRLCSPAQEAIDVAGIMHHPKAKERVTNHGIQKVSIVHRISWSHPREGLPPVSSTLYPDEPRTSGFVGVNFE